MDADSMLRIAKNEMISGDIKVAIKMYENMLEDKGDLVGIAAYVLGMIYQEGTRVDKDNEKSLSYLEFSEAHNCYLATYYLACLKSKQNDKIAAFKKFKEISEIHPSAAYWAYRLLVDETNKIEDEKSWEYYRDLAIEQGHIYAKRDEVRERAFGKKGLSKIIPGIIDWIKLYPEAKAAVRRDDKKLFT